MIARDTLSILALSLVLCVSSSRNLNREAFENFWIWPRYFYLPFYALLSTSFI